MFMLKTQIVQFYGRFCHMPETNNGFNGVLNCDKAELHYQARATKMQKEDYLSKVLLIKTVL